MAYEPSPEQIRRKWVGEPIKTETQHDAETLTARLRGKMAKKRTHIHPWEATFVILGAILLGTAIAFSVG